MPPLDLDAVVAKAALYEQDLAALLALENQLGALERGGVAGPALERRKQMASEWRRWKDALGRQVAGAVGKSPLGWWCDLDENLGVGRLQLGRLVLACGGDPTWNYAEGRPRRGPNEVWAYLGLHVVDGARPRRRRGVQCNWNTAGKTAAIQIAESCCRTLGSHWREDVYLVRKAAAEGKVHARQCQNTVRPGPTGPKGSNGCGTRECPELGAPGSPWRAGHKHQHALSVTAKEILKHLWIAVHA
jgi:hypothetical protein